MSVWEDLGNFVTANVSFGKFGEICGKIWENLVLIFFTENYQILIIKVLTAV